MVIQWKKKELIVCAFLLSSLKTYLIYNTTNHNIRSQLVNSVPHS